jgi:cardiolipin synthase
MPNLKHTLLMPSILSFVENIPAVEVSQLATRLSSAEGEASRGCLVTYARTAKTEHFYRALDAAWNTTAVTADALALALDVALKSVQIMQRKQDVTTVWTGPATEAVPLRRTEQVLCEIIDDAKETLLIVSFVAYKVKDVLAAIGRALQRNVRVVMVLETEKESGGKVSFDQAAGFKKDYPTLELYTWPLEKREKDEKGNYGSIHAKCAVADARVALVSSANLTEFALELNMELGLLVRGSNIAGAIAAHFDELIRRNILRSFI